MLPKSGDVVFTTDSFFPNYIKAMERKRRFNGEKCIIKGENTKKPADWNTFLANDEDKKQFIKLLARLCSQNSYASKLKGRKVAVVCEESVPVFTSNDGQITEKKELQSLNNTQEETDT